MVIFHSYVNVYQRVEPPPNPSEARTRRPIWSSEDVEEVSSRLQARENAPTEGRHEEDIQLLVCEMWIMWVGSINLP